MAFAVAGTKLPGVVINNPEVVSKTFPTFWEVLDTITSAPRPDNIVLIGMRGSGKNTIGELLAKRLGKQFIDMDAHIVKHAGQSIPDMVAEGGWEHFRDQESAVAASVGAETNAVIATGGGAILREQNVTALRQHGTFVLLTAPAATLAQRIEGDNNRPALTNQDSLQAELEELWQQRCGAYQHAADITVTTDNREPVAIAKEIERQLGGTA
jgi:shikimate kinase